MYIESVPTALKIKVVVQVLQLCVFCHLRGQRKPLERNLYRLLDSIVLPTSISLWLLQLSDCRQSLDTWQLI